MASLPCTIVAAAPGYDPQFIAETLTPTLTCSDLFLNIVERLEGPMATVVRLGYMLSLPGSSVQVPIYIKDDGALQVFLKNSILRKLEDVVLYATLLYDEPALAVPAQSFSGGSNISAAAASGYVPAVGMGAQPPGVAHHTQFFSGSSIYSLDGSSVTTATASASVSVAGQPLSDKRQSASSASSSASVASSTSSSAGRSSASRSAGNASAGGAAPRRSSGKRVRDGKNVDSDSDTDAKSDGDDGSDEDYVATSRGKQAKKPKKEREASPKARRAGRRAAGAPASGGPPAATARAARSATAATGSTAAIGAGGGDESDSEDEEDSEDDNPDFEEIDLTEEERQVLGSGKPIDKCHVKYQQIPKACMSTLNKSLTWLRYQRAQQALSATNDAAFAECHDDVCGVCFKGGVCVMCDYCPHAFHPQCVGEEAGWSGSPNPEDKLACWDCAEDLYDEKTGQRRDFLGPEGEDLPRDAAAEAAALKSRVTRRATSQELFSVKFCAGHKFQVRAVESQRPPATATLGFHSPDRQHVPR